MLFTLTEDNYTTIKDMLDSFIRQGLEVNTESAYFDLRSPIRLSDDGKYQPYDEETKTNHVVDFRIHDIKTMRISNLYCHIILN